MSIDLHAQSNRLANNGRHATPGWGDAMREIVDPVGKRVADVGCGGGIYSLGWHELGAISVVGVDFSEQMVAAAREQSAGLSDISFHRGEATATGLPAHSADIVFERALIHHLPSYDACFAEARRVLVPGGTLIVQDRTPEDVALPGTSEHLRGYFFECFPRLLTVEKARRPSDAAVRGALGAAGFRVIESRSLWEVRKTYASRDLLREDLAARTGRSILHDLDDRELETLIAYVEARLPANGPIVERDRWTAWSAIA
ncbi:MAG: class I SAM-dependent methyltransferase [Reyranella sp.]|uniref:class I SAM-dependent methyltransferase n=1 Tax=Reyranella sp. TaxID=1929291 RepID=UPI003D0BC299